MPESSAPAANAGLPSMLESASTHAHCGAPAPEALVATAAVRPASREASEGRVRASAAMDRYASGDDAAFADLYDALAPRLYGFLLRLSGDRAAAEDLLQQTFLKMHDARSRFAHEADVMPWAFAIGRRAFIDSKRRSKVRATDLVDAVILDERNAIDGASPEDWVIAHELEATIDTELASMPAIHRDAFQLVKQEGLSIAEAAAVLGVTGAAVKLRAHRAYCHLRAALEPVGGRR